MTLNIRFRFATILIASVGIVFAQKPSFAPGVNYLIGATPQAVVIGDLNGDGVPDLAVTNFGSKSISIYLGKGDGTLTAAPTPTVNGSPQSLVMADLNGDGKLDLVILLYPQRIAVLFGNGDGTFGSPIILIVDKDPIGIAVGDLNGDGKPDIAIVNQTSPGGPVGYITLLLNNGNGTFLPPLHPSAGQFPTRLKIADINGDGKGDLLVTDMGLGTLQRNGSLMVFLGNGDGTFQAAKHYAAGNTPVDLALGDFNGDGRPDVAIVDGPYLEPSRLAVLLGNGDGSFQTPTFIPLDPARMQLPWLTSTPTTNKIS